MTEPPLALAAVESLIDERLQAGERFFAAEAERLAALCHAMAERFARGGRLIALGSSPMARSDARHVAVEFVHPVIVGKRALPALALCAEGGDVYSQMAPLAQADDVIIAFGSEADTARAVVRARDRGCLTIGFAVPDAEWRFSPPTTDPFVAQELIETLYHLLWELVHVFFEHRGLLAGRSARPVHDVGASSFLYPFLAEREDNLDAVLDDVRRSVLMKADEIGGLRRDTLRDNQAVLSAAAVALRDCFDRGGTLFALGNGGSATDAMDAVADFRTAAGGGGGHRAIDLTEDPGILTAIANDIGTEAIFVRQIIAHGHSRDALLALSTSGGSANVIAALREARRQEMVTIALVGYDGGRIAAEGLADHVIVTRSQHIPRIQEAQASAYHVLRELVG